MEILQLEFNYWNQIIQPHSQTIIIHETEESSPTSSEAEKLLTPCLLSKSLFSIAGSDLFGCPAPSLRLYSVIIIKNKTIEYLNENSSDNKDRIHKESVTFIGNWTASICQKLFPLELPKLLLFLLQKLKVRLPSTHESSSTDKNVYQWVSKSISLSINITTL